MRLPFVIVCLAVTACSPGVDRDGYLQLAPIDSLLAQANITAPDPGPALAARAARLRARAAALWP